MNEWQIAQLNIARLEAPLDSAQLAEFVEQLDEINALADGAPGVTSPDEVAPSPFEDACPAL